MKTGLYRKLIPYVLGLSGAVKVADEINYGALTVSKL